MNLRVIDFDILTRSFQPYVDGYLNIEQEKKRLIDSIEPQKREMQSIINSSTSGIIVDELTQQKNIERFKVLQEELMKKDQEFKMALKEMRDDLNTSVYEQLSEIISEWSAQNDIDLVTGKMEVIFAKDSIDATDEIVQILKEKNLFHLEVTQESNQEDYQI